MTWRLRDIPILKAGKGGRKEQKLRWGVNSPKEEHISHLERQPASGTSTWELTVTLACTSSGSQRASCAFWMPLDTSYTSQFATSTTVLYCILLPWFFFHLCLALEGIYTYDPWYDFKRYPKRPCQRSSNYCTIALISHASKIMLKIIQTDFSNTWTMNFLMLKMDLEKAEGWTRD